MMFFVLVACLLVANSLCNANPCPAGWSHYEADNICIKNFSSKKCFLKARETCQLYGGDLIQIKSEAQKEFVLSLKNPYKNWIGLWDRNHDNHFTYVDGSEIGDFNQWNPTEPNNYGGNENCAIMYGYSGVAGRWNDVPCSLHLSFICSMEPVCPQGWSYYAGDNTCIKSFTTPEEFCHARVTCQDANGDLVKVDTEEKTSFILELGVPERNWIGFQDYNRDGIFHHLDGSEFDGYQPWNHGEPNNAGGLEFCGMMYGQGGSAGKWNDGDCRKQFPFICSAPPAIKVINCPDGWRYYPTDDLCVRNFGRPETFKGARSKCKSFGGDLIQIKNQAQEDFVRSLKLASKNWIGVADCDHDRQFNYIDGSAFGDYEPWNIGEPNNLGGEENCGMMYGRGPYAGKWNDASCSNKFSYICAVEN